MRFLVTSYDADEQQTLSDFIEAPDADTAKQIVGDARIFADQVSAESLDELREIAARLEAETDVPASAFALGFSLEGEDAALAAGTPEQLNEWAREPVGAVERARRQTAVDEELKGRE
jgi:hypothetical protein